MGFLGLNWQFPVWSRNKSGESFYDITSANEWGMKGKNLFIAQNHPLLTPALLFVSKMFSQAEFELTRKSSGTSASSPMLDLLNKPNHLQSRSDFLESLLFTQIANGVGVVYIKKTFGLTTPNSLYVLDYNLIDFPESLKTKKFKNQGASSESYLNTTVVYDSENENLPIKLKDLLFFYDLPNGLNENPFLVSSRLDGIRQTLENAVDGTKAKNIIIKSNGKEMISGQKDGFPLGKEEKQQLEHNYNNNYGTGWNRNRGLITKSNIKWQSLHIIARDLGYDEGTKTDASIIFTALHIPRDVYSISGEKSTYQNANASLISYIQNELMPTLNSFVEKISELFPDNLTLTGSYNHLPVMLPSLTITYDNVTKQVTALNAARLAGIPDKMALEMVGLPLDTVLADLIKPNNESASGKKETESQKAARIIKESLL
jgi:HK97 family phage portal protein